MNQNPYIKEQIDASLKGLGNKNITGFVISNEDIDLANAAFPCPWQGNHYNIALPNVALNINKLSEGWRTELMQFNEIQVLHILIDIEDLDFVRKFPNLKELHIYDSTCKDWSFLGELTELDTLFIYKASCFDTAPLRILTDKQVSRMEAYRIAVKSNSMPILPIPRVLDEILLNYCNLTDANLLDLATNKSITELNLSHNEIKSIDNLKDVAVYYLTLRYNALTDIESMQYAPYYLNVRHNQISKLPDFGKAKRCQLSRLYAGHNPLSETEVERIKKLRLLKTDLY